MTTTTNEPGYSLNEKELRRVAFILELLNDTSEPISFSGNLEVVFDDAISLGKLELVETSAGSVRTWRYIPNTCQ